MAVVHTVLCMQQHGYTGCKQYTNYHHTCMQPLSCKSDGYSCCVACGNHTDNSFTSANRQTQHCSSSSRVLQLLDAFTTHEA